MNQSNPKDNTKNYAKYSGMAFQLLAITAVGTYIGHLLDQYFEFKTPYLSALGAIVFLILALYLVLKDLIQNK